MSLTVVLLQFCLLVCYASGAVFHKVGHGHVLPFVHSGEQISGAAGSISLRMVDTFWVSVVSRVLLTVLVRR